MQLYLHRKVSLIEIQKSNAGGGGERVLWTAIAAIQRQEPDLVCVVYTGDFDFSKDAIIERVKVCLASMFGPSDEFSSCESLRPMFPA